MRIPRSGRFFFIAQWLVPPLLVLVLLFGRRLAVELAGEHPFAGPVEVPDPLSSAFVALAAVVILAPVAVPWTLLLWLPATVTMADREVRRSRRTRLAYGVSAAVAWTAAVPASLGVPSLWDDAGFRNLTVVPLFPEGPSVGPGLEVAGVIGAGIGLGAWVASVLFAIAGVVVARSDLSRSRRRGG